MTIIMLPLSLLHPALALLLAPLLLSVIARTKAFFGGRVGPPWLQPYYDLARLLRKGSVYSHTTNWVFRAGPIVGLAAVFMAMTLIPFAGVHALVSFQGDLILFAYLLGLMRFFTVLAALDTGSSFEGMGASREVQFAALVEPALFIGLATVARHTESVSLSEMFGGLSGAGWAEAGAALGMVAIALTLVFLSENSRIPVDDPNTHLELTMIHEVMVLDHSGPDFAFILYGAALKLWVLGALIVGIVLPVHSGSLWRDFAVTIGGMLLLAILTGVVESTLARLRLVRVPHLLVGAGVLSVLALFLVLR